MTASVEDLPSAKAEKERMEQELRIARLDPDVAAAAGAAENGRVVGDRALRARARSRTYDYLPLGDRRVGIIIATWRKGNVRGALHGGAEGLMLSLGQRTHHRERYWRQPHHRAPSRRPQFHDDVRWSTCAATLTYARRPLSVAVSAGSGQIGIRTRKVQVQICPTAVLGLKIDNGERFESLLEEVTLHLGVGDVVLLFTDGVTDAMNAEGEPFGEERVAALLEEHGDLPFEELRERILREIRAFVGDTGLHDDLTLVLLKVDEIAAPAQL